MPTVFRVSFRTRHFDFEAMSTHSMAKARATVITAMSVHAEQYGLHDKDWWKRAGAFNEEELELDACYRGPEILWKAPA